MLESTERQNFSLRSLFLLVAVCGILLSLVIPVNQAFDEFSFGYGEVAFHCTAGGFSLMIAALLTGWVLFPRRPRFALSALIGLILGILLGPVGAVVFHSLWHVETNRWIVLGMDTQPNVRESYSADAFIASLLGACLGGSAVLLILAYFFQAKTARNREVSDPTSDEPQGS